MGPRRIPRPVGQRFPLGRLLRANLYDLLLLLRESWIVLIGFGLLTLTGTAYIRLTYHLPIVVALYETLKLLTLQSGLDLPSESLGQVIFFLIPLFGLALIFQSVLNFGRLLFDKGARREAWQVALASTYRDHVIVCGLGRVSLRVVTQLLDTGNEVVIIERTWESEFVARVLNLKVPVVLGDAREAATLHQAGLLQSRALVAGTGDDLLNVEIALTARAERPTQRAILRVFNEALDRNLERVFGVNSAFSTSALAAPTFAAAAISREIDHVLPIGDHLLGITRLVIQSESQLSGLVSAIERAHDIRVLQHQDGKGQIVAPRLMRHLASGDEVTLLGSISALESLRRKNLHRDAPAERSGAPIAHPTAEFNTVIICGLGKVGYRVVRQLCQIEPHPRIVVVRLHETRSDFSHQISNLEGVTTVLGDARDPMLLRAAGIASAYSVAALTADDLLNVQIGLAARHERPDIHVVLRVFSDVLAEKLADMFGIRTIYSTSGIAAPTLAAAALLGDSGHAFVVGGRLFATIALIAVSDDIFVGRTIAAIRNRYDVLVIGITRGGLAHTPPSLDSTIAAGDELTLLAPVDTLQQVRTDLRRRIVRE